MDSILEQITDWLKEMLVSGIMQNLSGMFDSVNQRVGDIATQVGTIPAAFSPGIFGMIRNVSESVIVPIAGMILTFIACYELIQMIIDHNNLANFEPGSSSNGFSKPFWPLPSSQTASTSPWRSSMCRSRSSPVREAS